jgi:hypothetical protein
LQSFLWMLTARQRAPPSDELSDWFMPNRQLLQNYHSLIDFDWKRKNVPASKSLGLRFEWPPPRDHSAATLAFLQKLSPVTFYRG